MSRWTLVALVAFSLAPACGRRGEPAQPIPFSHSVHAGKNRIGCLMCHAYALHGLVAGVPSMARCFGCHKFVARDKPGVKRTVEVYLQKKTIAWNQVYRVPDHVRFSHQPHLAAALRCQTCHGEVQTMAVVRLAQPLLMGWCLDCHRARQAPTDCSICHK